MSRKSLARKMVATLVLFAAAVTAALVAASPALADGDPCCDVSIDNLPGQFQAGGEPGAFTLHVVNQTNDGLRYLNVSFGLQASGLVGDLVRLQRQRVGAAPHNVGTFTMRGVHSGAVTANDQIDFGDVALPPGGGVDIEYQLSFNRKMPSTGLEISVQVQPRRSDGGTSAGGPYSSAIVAVGQAMPTQPDPTPTPSPSISETPATEATDVAVPTDKSSLAGDGSSTGDGGSLMWLAYTVGALLLLGGVGVIGTLLWRRGPHDVETEWVEPQPHRPAYPTQPGGYRPGPPVSTRAAPSVYGAPSHHTTPTTRFPVSQDPYANPDQTHADPTASR